MDITEKKLCIILNRPPKDYFEEQVQDFVLSRRVTPDEMQIMEVYLNASRIKRQAYFNYLNRNAARF